MRAAPAAARAGEHPSCCSSCRSPWASRPWPCSGYGYDDVIIGACGGEKEEEEEGGRASLGPGGRHETVAETKVMAMMLQLNE